MKRTGVMLAMLVVGLLSVGAMAQIEVREEVEATRQTPRGTLKLLRQAMEQGDADALRSILLGETEVEKQLVEAMIETARSAHRLREAAVQTFGEREATSLFGAMPATSPSEMTEIDEASETIEEDRAVVQFADVQVMPVTLVRRGEQWHVPVAELAGKLPPDELEERISEVRAFCGVMVAIAEEITQGKYQNIEQVRQALSSQMMRAVTPEGQ